MTWFHYLSCRRETPTLALSPPFFLPNLFHSLVRVRIFAHVKDGAVDVLLFFLPRCCGDNKCFPQRLHETQLLRGKNTNKNKKRRGKVLLSARECTRSARMRQKEKRENNPTKWSAGRPKGSPEVHAAFREVNKLKKRQKGGGWSLINRRSHTLLISTACFRPMEPNVFPLPSFSLLLAVT